MGAGRHVRSMRPGNVSRNEMRDSPPKSVTHRVTHNAGVSRIPRERTAKSVTYLRHVAMRDTNPTVGVGMSRIMPVSRKALLPI